MHCFTTEPFHASMFFSVVRLPIPHMICSLPALRRMSTALHLPGSSQASVLPFPLSFMLSNAVSEFITYAFAFPFLGEFAKWVLVRSRPALHVRCAVVQMSGGIFVSTKALLRQHVPELARQGATQTPPNPSQTRGTVASQLLCSVPRSF